MMQVSLSQTDPITGQVSWYAVRVQVYKAEDNEPEVTSPQFNAMKVLPGMERKRKKKWQSYVAGKFRDSLGHKLRKKTGKSGEV